MAQAAPIVAMKKVWWLLASVYRFSETDCCYRTWPVSFT